MYGKNNGYFDILVQKLRINLVLIDLYFYLTLRI